MVYTGRGGLQARDRSTSTARNSLEDPVEAERRPVPILCDEQNPTRVEALDAPPQQGLEILAQRPESAARRRCRGRIQHDPRKALTRAERFEKATPIDADGFVACRIDAAISSGR